ncbi:MAG: NF038122 family metalloprotease [Desulfobacca sp.]|uniref:NF038122 family metalloprotease n=1 Tax=Desulfobacca sp. TaxID=2067990 RepID=UPI00404A1484
MKRLHWPILAVTLVVLFGIMPAAQALVININPGAGLAANADALAAFKRGAAQWAVKFTDPITVNINADLQPLGPGILGQASSFILTSTYGFLKNQMIADALGYPEHAIVSRLPDNPLFYVPPGISLSAVSATKANWKALGVADPYPADADAQITFSTNFSWTFERPGGTVTPGTYDFETVAAHEIGHALGFFSDVDYVDFLVYNNQTASDVWPTPLDLFRFREGEAPTTLTEFQTRTRSLEPNVAAVTADTIFTFPMSTGRLTGDGRQASHWKDDALLGYWIGLMDPTLASGAYFDVADADVRALDLMGYDLRVVVPLPGAVFCWPPVWGFWCSGDAVRKPAAAPSHHRRPGNDTGGDGQYHPRLLSGVTLSLALLPV